MMERSPDRFGISWLAPAVVFAVALLLFSLNLDRSPHPDELHHVLAAEDLLETGRPIIAEGEYHRGILHTWMVALSYAAFGESLASARLPTVLLMSTVGVILFLWIRREAGSLAAMITAALFITSPLTVEIAQFSRFYALQMLFFTLAAMSIYFALAPNLSAHRRALYGGLGALLFALATWMQETTLIGLVGVGAWVAGVVLTRLFRDSTRQQAHRRAMGLLLATAGAAALLVIGFADELTWAFWKYRTASLFAQERVDEFWFYYLRYFLFYPTLWTLTGVLSVYAVVRSPRLGWLAVAVFGISFLLTSFAAQKAMRYFAYAQPFLSIIWGVGLGFALPAFWRYNQSAQERLAGALALPARLATGTAAVLVAIALAMVVLMNPFWIRTATVIADVAMPMEAPTTNWRAARAALAPWTANADIMITTEELGAIYFLGRSDVRFSPSKFRELPEGDRVEFGIDPRIGRPVISTPESLEKLMLCFDSGFIVGPLSDWKKANLINEPVQATIRNHARPVKVPAQSHLYAWGWQRRPTDSKPDYCAALAQFSKAGRQRP